MATTQNISTTGNLLATSTKLNSALASFRSAPGSWVTAFINPGRGIQANFAKANIPLTISQPNSVKAYLIYLMLQSNLSRANITAGYYLKRFSYKLYYSATDIRDVWGDEVISDPTFRSTINGGVGEIVVTLARKIDAFGEDDEIVLNRQVDVYVYDRDTPNGLLLYRGYISGYTPVVDSFKETVEITILGYISETSTRILKDSSGYTAIKYLSEDPTNIFRDIIEKHQADGGHLSYSISSTDLTNTTVTYTFNVNTIKESLDQLIQLAPDGWYYFIGADGVCSLKQSSTTVATHTLYIGKHIKTLRPEKRLDNLRNRIYFVGGEPGGGSVQLYRVYTRGSSETSWGLREEKLVDQRVTIADTADIKARRYLDQHDGPEIRTTLTVIDNNGENSDMGYNIETIKPGDTISIANLKSSRKGLSYWDQMIWDQSKWNYTVSGVTSDLLQVISTVYYPDRIEIEAAVALPYVQKRIEDIKRNLDYTITSTIPTLPTQGSV